MIAAVAAALVAASAGAPSALAADAGTVPELRAALEPITGVVGEEIRAGRFPGAVVLIGNGGEIVYRRAFGVRQTTPERLPMTEDTIFDLASLTKVVATTTAIMQLVDQGKLLLEVPVARYWPAFARNGKSGITVEELLTHRSGLRADLDLRSGWRGRDAALARIVAERPLRPPGSSVLYSDINFEVLGEIVQRISGEPLDSYCRRHIFEPLGMPDTGFRPGAAASARIAPTAYSGGRLRRGEVHDPTADRMGGVAGHAGLFSTADDLAVFAQMLLDGGRGRGATILQPDTVRRMTTAGTPGSLSVRGLGWEIGAPLGPKSYGHSGYTGTSLWIDPVTQSYAIVLTNRVYPNDRGDARPVRQRIAAIVAEALGVRPSRYATGPQQGVRSGIDVLAAERFSPLIGKRIGLITNESAIDAEGRRTIDVFDGVTALRLVALFSPEHGLRVDSEGTVASGREPGTGLPVHSLYGKARRPTPAMLRGLDALVFDIQDAGVRFYTYVTTMGYAMEAAAKQGIPFYVLDRPNPISAAVVQGPILQDDLRSFTGYYPLPVRYGMTIGELARLFNAENRIGVELHVIALQGYRREQWFDETGLRWLRPSPNLRSLNEVTLYPGVALLEGANVSVGRGTETPFEIVGAPWIDGPALASYLSERRIDAVRFEPSDFTPTESPFRGALCHGIRIRLLDRRRLDAPGLGVEIASALHRLFAERFDLAAMLGMIGDRATLEAIRGGADPRSIVARWQGPLADFLSLRARFLIY